MSEKVIFALGGDVKTLETIGHTLGSLPLEVICFMQPSKFMQRLRCENCDLAIADLTMRGIDGVGLATQITRLRPWVPVIALIDKGAVTAAIAATKAGVADIVEKPLNGQRLKLAVESLLRENVHANAHLDKPLTTAEMRVLKLIIADRTNSEMALMLNRSLRTIEWHRANIMKKLGAESLVGLIKRAAVLGIVDLGVRGDRCDSLHESG